MEKPVKRATVYASALGNYELYLNGRQVGDAYFTPGWTDYNIRVYYNTFDVTDRLKKGFNALGGILADGWYSGHIGWMHIRDHYGPNPRFAAQLHIEYADGSSRDRRHGQDLEGRDRPDPRRRLPDGRDLRRPQGDAGLEHARTSTTPDGSPSMSPRRSTAKIESYPERPGPQVPGDQAGEDDPVAGGRRLDLRHGHELRRLRPREGPRRPAGPEDRPALRRAAQSRRHDLHDQPAQRPRHRHLHLQRRRHGGLAAPLHLPRLPVRGADGLSRQARPRHHHRRRADLRHARGRRLRLLRPDGQHAVPQHLPDAAGQLHRHPDRLPAARRAAGLDGRRPDLRPHRHVQHRRRGVLHEVAGGRRGRPARRRRLLRCLAAQGRDGRRHGRLGRRRRDLPLDDLPGLRRHAHPRGALRRDAELDRVLQGHARKGPAAAGRTATATG